MLKNNLTLGKKALLLVLIPLVLDVIFLLTLWYMLEQSRLEAQEEEHARLITSQTGLLGQHISEAAGSLAAYQFSHTPAYLERYELRCQTAKEDLKDLKSLAQKENIREQETIKDIESSTGTIFECMEESRSLMDRDPANSINPLALNKRINAAILKLRNNSDKMNALQILGKPDLLRRSRQEHSTVLMNAILLGILGNVAVAVSLTLYFNNGTTLRLKQLMNNTERLASRQQIMPCLEGNDEIARLDQSFHKMADELKAAEKVKEDLMAMVSHDLRTPITSGLLFLEMLNEGCYGEQSEECNRATGRIQESMQRVVLLVNELLDLEKMQSGRFSIDVRETDLNRIARRSLDSVDAVAQAKGVRLSFEDNGRMPLQADEDRLVQVVVNLLANAIKFSPDGGTVYLSVAIEAERASVSVRDEGEGVKEEMRDKIFEPFEQAPETAKGGFGLGLAICRRIIDAHNGLIYVKPAPDRGSIFAIEIPITQ